MTSEEKQGPRLAEGASQFALRHIDWVLAVLITLTSLILFALSGWSGNPDAGFAFLRSIEDSSLDLRFAMRGPRPHDARIVIVGIDEKTLQRIGSFPLPRKEYALLVNRLHEAGARVVAFDVTFPVPESNSARPALEQLRRELGTAASPAVLEHVRTIEQASDQDALLASSMKNAGNVLLGHIFLDSQPDPDLAEQYFNIAWAHSFPQVLKVNAKDAADFDIAHAWSENHGSVMAGAEANIAKLADAAASFGFINIAPDSDGTLRHALMMMRYQDQDYFPSLDLEIVRRYEAIPDQHVAAYIASNGLERIQLGRHKLLPAHSGSALINYTGPYRTYTQYSMWDVISGATPADAFRDKIVLVGGTALAIGDIRNTPFANQDPVYMGVEVHANIIDNLLHSGEKGRGFLQRTTYEEMADIGFIFLFGLGFGFLFSRITPLYSTVLVLLALAAYGWFVYFGFARKGQWFSFVIPAMALAANYAAITSVRMIREEREKRKIRKTFSQYLSPGVIDLIEKDPEKYIRTGGEMKELTVLFSDIRGFTTLSESLTPNELVLLLNEYFGQMTDVIFATDGTLDKYIGDAIMAFWGSPYPQADHAFRSCSCALQMVRSLAQLNAKWQAAGHPPISTGIGLNTGLVNVGNMGSARRLSWTVMGDNVNLASRLEGITKEYHVPLIISEATYRQVASQFVCRELDKIRVKGKNQPVTIYELLDVVAEKSKYTELLAHFEQAMLAYRAQDWSVAAAGFAAILDKFPDDGPSRVFLGRALEFSKAAPEAEWDGVYVMKTK
jgi:adenylate cyclase